jgi:Winged helix DNA-binding domain
LLALTAPTRMTANARRLAQEGVTPDDADRAVAIIERALAEDGPLTRPQLAERVAAAGVRTEGQATPHLLMLAALRGVAVLGPMRDRAQAYVLARDWLGAEAQARHDRDAALAELARRYLAGHGPAIARDLAGWAGLPLRDARAGLAAIATEPAGAGELVDLDARPGDAPAPVPPRLLGAFDPYLLGWRDRAFAVPEARARRVHPGGGMLRAVALLDGAAAGTWSARRRSGGRLEITIEPFARLEPEAFDAERADVKRFESVS